MSRIVYLGFPSEKITGGQKTILRHVETLCKLGFDAVYWTNSSGKLPQWLSHSAPIVVGTRFRDDDILIVPEDAPNAIATIAGMPQRSLIFCQSQITFASIGMDAGDKYPGGSPPAFLACSQTVAETLGRAFPLANIELVPCFVDELVFCPLATRRNAIAYMPQKRPLEARAIPAFFKRYHPVHRDVLWLPLEGRSEAFVASTLGSSSIFLSLARLEAFGLAALEAMLCGCVVVGFTGIGGREFATADNGFWVADDDCEAAVDALARAAALVKEGGAPLERCLTAGRETARSWSYVRFKNTLEEVWNRLAPDARHSPRPPDAAVLASSSG